MAPVEVDDVTVDNDEFFEEDPFQEAEEEEDTREVGEEDVKDAECEEGIEEEIVPVLFPVAAKVPKKMAVGKEEETTLAPPTAPLPKKVGPLAEWEQFKLHKFNEADLRDTGAKAICKIKSCLRQPGAQADGKLCIPPDWDTRFKPVIGSFKRFILTRPDQFRIITGAEPGVYSIARVSTEVVAAPSLESIGKGKKGKGKAKGRFGDHGKGNKGKSWGKGKDKGKEKGKDNRKGKVWGRPWDYADAPPFTDSKAWGSIAQATLVGPSPDVGANLLQVPRASHLLAIAARDALAEYREAQEQKLQDKEAAEVGEVVGGAEDEAEAGEEVVHDEWLPDEEEEAPGPDKDPIMNVWKPTPESGDVGGGVAGAEDKDDDDGMFPADKPASHGSFISTLLSSSLLCGGAKRPRLAA